MFGPYPYHFLLEGETILMTHTRKAGMGGQAEPRLDESGRLVTEEGAVEIDFKKAADPPKDQGKEKKDG